MLAGPKEVGYVMIRQCDSCHKILYDGDAVVAAMDSIYHEIPSLHTYAIDQPNKCRGLIHLSCYGPTEAQDVIDTTLA